MLYNRLKKTRISYETNRVSKSVQSPFRISVFISFTCVLRSSNLKKGKGGHFLTKPNDLSQKGVPPTDGHMPMSEATERAQVRDGEKKINPCAIPK